MRDNVRFCALVFVAVRAGLGLLALVGTALLPGNDPVDVPGWPAPEPAGWDVAITAWERWDALWYLRIADTGYAQSDGSAAFFPLYPLLVRAAAGVLGGHPLPAALLVTNASAFAALILLAHLTTAELGPATARRTVLYLALFPTGFFLVAPYAEALFLLLSLATFATARAGRWKWAGFLGGLAATTRPLGALLALPMAVFAFRSGQRRDGLVAAAAIPAGLAVYLGAWLLRAGDPLLPFTSQGAWLRAATDPLRTLALGLREGARLPGEYPAGYPQVDLVLTLAVIAAAVWVVRRAPLPYAVYVTAALLVPLALVFPGRPLMSMSRFALPLFPLFWALARSAERFGVHDAIVAASAAGLGVLTVLYVNWYYIL